MIPIKNGFFMQGDCLERMRELPDASVDMILCDLPYGTTQNAWDSVIPFEPLWAEYWRVAKPNAAIVLTAQCPFDKVLGASQLRYLRYEWVWVKPNGTGFLNAKKMPLKTVENILVFYKQLPVYNPQMRTGFKPYKLTQGRKSENYRPGKVGAVSESNGERYPTQVLEYAPERGVHPTQKPVALFEYLIRTYTNPGALVLDNCAGCGTTAIACENTGRMWVCIERDETYAALAMARVLDHDA